MIQPGGLCKVDPRDDAVVIKGINVLDVNANQQCRSANLGKILHIDVSF